MKSEENIGILGVGNTIVGDEGFGVHAVSYLDRNFVFPDNVRLQDGGTAGIFLSPFLEECDRVIVIDAVDIDAEPGSLHYYSSEDVKAGKISTRMSPHQLGLLEVLEICKLRDAAPQHLEFYCVVPKSLEPSTELSDVVAPKIQEIARLVLARLEELGIQVRQRSPEETV
jgi:hydrogenase maturation protease